MKKLFLFIVVLAMTMSLAACGGPAEERPEAVLSIVTTVFPAYDFARQIA